MGEFVLEPPHRVPREGAWPLFSHRRQAISKGGPAASASPEENSLEIQVLSPPQPYRVRDSGVGPVVCALSHPPVTLMLARAPELLLPRRESPLTLLTPYAGSGSFPKGC